MSYQESFALNYDRSLFLSNVKTYKIRQFKSPNYLTIERANGPCMAYKFSKDEVSAVLKSQKKELDSCGVYLLLSWCPMSAVKIYVGEAENIGMRIRQHIKRPPFAWNSAIAFVSSGDRNSLWEKSSIKYMEHALYVRLPELVGCEMVNRNTPKKSKVSDPEIWDEVVDEITDLFQFLGIPLVPEGTQDPDGEQVQLPAGERKSLIDGGADDEAEEYHDFGYAMGSIASSVLIEMNKSGELSSSDFIYLESNKSAADFKLRGAPAIKLCKGLVDEDRDAHGRKRFLKDTFLRNGRKTYMISVLFYPESFLPFMKWCRDRGFDEQKVRDVCISNNARKQRTCRK